MLVLTRRQDEKIFFPQFATSIQILETKSGRVRLGIDAPQSVTVLREEVAPKQPAEIPAERAIDAAAVSRLTHTVRNHLNTASMALELARCQVQAGQLSGIEGTLSKAAAAVAALSNVVSEIDPTPPSPIPSSSSSNPTRGRVLLVEDDRNECELLAGFLRMAGLEVETVHDGCEAIDFLNSHRCPDLLLLDMMLPGCDGPTAVRQIRGIPGLEEMKIIGVSGYAQNHFKTGGQPLSVDGWFRKPLNPQRLLDRIAEELAA